MRLPPLLLAILSSSYALTTSSSSTTTNLFISSYFGQISTLSLIHNKAANNYSLTTLSSTYGSAPQPSWLERSTKGSTKGLIYAVNENWTGPNGTLASYTSGSDGSLKQLDLKTTLGGPVHSRVYNDGKAIAIANYVSSSIQTFSLGKNGSLTGLQTIIFPLFTQPGPVKERQEASHPHQIILDPTGSFIIIPDLGADLLRVFAIDKKTSLLSALSDVSVKAVQDGTGVGPRHAVFFKSTRGITFLYLLTEISNELVTYQVSYTKGKKPGLAFKEVARVGAFGPDVAVPVGAAAAEISISPNTHHLIISTRNSTSTLPYPSTPYYITDPLSTFTITPTTGILTFNSISPAGGLFPRHFSLNKKGDLIAVGLQGNEEVAVFKRDVKSGKIGVEVARTRGVGWVTAVLWDE